MLRAWNLPCRTIELSDILGQEVHAHIGTRKIPDAHAPEGVMKGTKGAPLIINPVANIGVQRLLVDGSRQAKIAAGRPERIMVRAKYRVQNSSH